MSVRPSTDVIDTMLSIIPGLPRSVLDRLVTDMIDRMDELNGDPDWENDEREQEWFARPVLHLPGVRGDNWSSIGRLRLGQVKLRHRRRPLGHHWRKRTRH